MESLDSDVEERIARLGNAQQRISALSSARVAAADDDDSNSSMEDSTNANATAAQAYKDELSGIRSQLQQLAIETKESEKGSAAFDAMKLLERCHARICAALTQAASSDSIDLHDLHLLNGILGAHSDSATILAFSRSSALAKRLSSQSESAKNGETLSLIRILATVAERNDSYDSVFVALSALTKLVSSANLSQALVDSLSIRGDLHDLCAAAAAAARRCLASPATIPAVVRWQLFAFLSAVVTRSEAAKQFLAHFAAASDSHAASNGEAAIASMKQLMRQTLDAANTNGNAADHDTVLTIPEALIDLQSPHDAATLAVTVTSTVTATAPNASSLSESEAEAERQKVSDYARIASIEYHSSTVASVHLELMARLCKAVPAAVLNSCSAAVSQFMVDAIRRSRDVHTRTVAELTKQIVDKAVSSAERSALGSGSGGGSGTVAAIPSVSVSERCAACGAEAVSLKACAGCRKVFYCGRDCQSKHWKQHKGACAATKHKQKR